MSDTSAPAYRRILLKLSGEALRSPGSMDNISPEIVARIAEEIAQAHRAGVQIGLVVGGGNFWRGAKASVRGMDRATADYVGMLATVMNALALQSALERAGVPCVVQSAIEMKNVAESFIRLKARSYLDNNKIVIFAAGTGNPFFSTDTTAALRASEINAEVVMKATSVDGVYDADPKKVSGAKRFDTISYQECLERQLKVMDSTAFTLCMDNKKSIIVFDINRGSLEDYVGNREIAADARTLYASHGIDKAIVDCNPISLERAALAGDEVAEQVWRDLAVKLSCALMNCCYLLNPEAIIIGGGVAKARTLLFQPLQEIMKTQLAAPLVEYLEILPAQFGTEAGILGAAHLALNTHFGETFRA